jgi:hypothetical protein
MVCVSFAIVGLALTFLVDGNPHTRASAATNVVQAARVAQGVEIAARAGERVIPGGRVGRRT